MAEQVYYENVEIGSMLPAVERDPVRLKDLVMWSGAIDDYNEFHYDADVARERGLPGPLTHGPFKSALITQMVMNWISPDGDLKKLSCQYRRMDVVNDRLTCKGKVMNKYVSDGENLVELELWSENGKGEVTTRGSALVALPARTAAPVAAPPSLISDEMRQQLQIGVESAPFVYAVDKNWIGRFAAAIDDDNPLWRDEEYARKEGRWGAMIAPPTFCAALDPVETKEILRQGFMQRIPYAPSGGGNAFNEYEYFQPIRAGDIIATTVTYTDTIEKAGRSGLLVFLMRDNVHKNQRGEIVACSHNAHVFSFDLSRQREG